ncbi:hypothetical protein UFOVP1262_23 [uncultured Caudovirales phage]|uniref:Uncharacterized protein n=1 Tax=uncultured Caudovirales phage TaxID=2100421 RepID=A0A6J5Q987_9CAUD|nr:hypothetical protein UFOVP863_23 [uncultured Caudovirales phage]CAB4180052.1 hypothetical protein UFOVP1042_1 [uncultured Caudovirales phage]CAB4194146.1 hypothetical protein UFOVP1262_23 [uncultured Caudovirales phage]
MRKSSMDLTRAVRYKSLASACARLLATAMLAIGAGLFIYASPITEAADAAEVKEFNIKEYIQSHLTLVTYQCLDELATHESNWNFKAVNGSHYGFMQGRSEWLRTANEEQQYDWSSRYVANRYGVTEYDEPDFCAALNHWKLHSWH